MWLLDELVASRDPVVPVRLSGLPTVVQRESAHCLGTLTSSAHEPSACEVSYCKAACAPLNL